MSEPRKISFEQSTNPRNGNWQRVHRARDPQAIVAIPAAVRERELCCHTVVNSARGGLVVDDDSIAALKRVAAAYNLMRIARLSAASA
jgi:hypothetical protein